MRGVDNALRGVNGLIGIGGRASSLINDRVYSTKRRRSRSRLIAITQLFSFELESHSIPVCHMGAYMAISILPRYINRLYYSPNRTFLNN